MRAHKVPATYYSGWKTVNQDKYFYVFYKTALQNQGILTKFRKVRNFEPEHLYFMDYDFYEINFSINGIEYKLRDEIEDYFSANNQYRIVSEGELVDCYDKYMYHKDVKDSWTITNQAGTSVLLSQFEDEINTYILGKVGDKIETEYFAHYLEPLWREIKDAIRNDIVGLNSMDDVTLSRRTDFLEFFTIQYLRTEDYLATEVQPTLDLFKGIFVDLFEGDEHKEQVLADGMFYSDVYFYGRLLDIARGDKRSLHNIMQKMDRGYVIDVLKADVGGYYLTSSNPCVITKYINRVKEEVIFPVDKEICVRLRAIKTPNDSGKYIVQDIAAVKQINNQIINASNNIVMSHLDNISNLI